MLRDVVEPDGQRLVDQEPEDPSPVRQVADARDVVGSDADGDELRQPAVLAGRVEDAEGGVARADEVRRGADDPVQDVVELEVRADGDHGLQQPLQPVGEGRDALDPLDDLGQQGPQAQPVEVRELTAIPSVGHPTSSRPDQCAVSTPSAGRREVCGRSCP
jgi:hypothetical protein